MAAALIPGAETRTRHRVNLPLDDVLLWVATQRKTGTLYVEGDGAHRVLVFEEGVLQYCSSSDPREKLGQLLLARDLVSEIQLRAALRRQEQTGIQLGILLVSEGCLTGEQLYGTLRAKTEQIARDLFLSSDAGFEFEESVPDSVPLRSRMDTLAVIRHGQARRERVRRIREAFGGADVAFHATGEMPAPADRVRARILKLAKAGRTLAQIVPQTRLSEFEVADYLLALCELGVLRVAPAADPA